MTFKVGDVVLLNSGGPEMTVEENSAKDGYVWCQWFGGRKLERGRFPVASLVPAPKDAGDKK